jgi:hypothetical protein
MAGAKKAQKCIKTKMQQGKNEGPETKRPPEGGLSEPNQSRLHQAQCAVDPRRSLIPSLYGASLSRQSEPGL